ncbi:MAG: bifunctional tetrahydrofolate synthase/dihydrofolate synthase [Burkholderiaceae bacterium]|jgi:dihydrofolate synthase/folylpolyglutamate synthase
MTKPETLDAWLEYVESLHPQAIAMGLERSREVAKRLGLQFGVPVITVGGTNGKGSTCAMLESILLHAGYRVGLYIKPHFLSFTERARVNGHDANADSLVTQFEAVESARTQCAPPIELTYYEFTTLAILRLLSLAPLDVVILEVGLGGRLDTVNLIDADCSIVTSIDVDHVDYLGDTREKIGFEKAGIYRPGRPAICGDPLPPESLVAHARSIGADFWRLGVDFNFSGDRLQWNFAGRGVRRASLGYPALRGANQLLNASAALAALEALREVLPVSQQAVRTGLLTVELTGRFQVLPGRPSIILDVAHNPHAAAALAQNLDNMGFFPFTLALFGVMRDKDIEGILRALGERVDHWFLTGLPSTRAARVETLRAALFATGFREDRTERTIHSFDDPEHAYRAALSWASENDRIVVFGSFITVAAVLQARARDQH